MSEIIKELYIGDGVYAQFSGFDVRLHTQEGNEVYLEFPMIELLQKELNKLQEQYRAEGEHEERNLL